VTRNFGGILERVTVSTAHDSPSKPDEIDKNSNAGFVDEGLLTQPRMGLDPAELCKEAVADASARSFVLS